MKRVRNKAWRQARASKAGKLGGPARAAALPFERRVEIAKQGAAARWRKADSEPGG